MSKKLMVDNGQRRRELLLVGNLVIGRDPLCDVTDADVLLSRRHAEFVLDGNKVAVRDLGSRNGVFVNGQKVAEGPLRPGDLVQIGNLRVHYVEDDAPLSTDVAMTEALSPDLWQQSPSGPGAASAIALPPMNDEIDSEGTSVLEPMFDGMSEARSPRLPAIESVGRVAAGAAAPSPAGAAPAAGSIRQKPGAHPRPVRAGSWSTFVYLHVAMLSVIVLAASMIPLALQGGEITRGAGLWLALPVVVALVATYAIGQRISRRTMKALTTLNQDVELAASGGLEAIDDPPAPRSRAETPRNV
jgi:hypothetical protein